MAEASQHIENGLNIRNKRYHKTSPPIIVTGMTLAGIQLQDWLIMVTIIYTVIQIIIALPELKSL